jgi:hypothetical protein
MAAPPTSGVPARIAMVVLSARDLPALRRFYRGLGWTEQTGATDELAFFPLGEVTLALFARTAGDPETERDRSRLEDRSAMTLVIRCESGEALDDAFAHAARVGAQTVSGPQDQSFGGRSAVLADPEGNRWELLWVPGATGAG